MNINSDCTLRSSGALGSVQGMVPAATIGLGIGVKKNQPVEESGCEKGLYSNNRSQALRTTAFEDGDYIERKEFGGNGGASSEMDSKVIEEKPFKFSEYLSSVSKISNVNSKAVKPKKTTTNGAVDGQARRWHGGKGGEGRGLTGLAGPILEGPPSVFSSKAENTFNIKPASSRVAESADSPMKVFSQNKAVPGASEDINEDGIKGPGSSEMVTSSIHDTNIKKELILGSKVKVTPGGKKGRLGKRSSKDGLGQGNAPEPFQVSPSKKSKGTTSLLRLYEMDTNPERKKFLDELIDYMEKRSTPITRCPILGQKPVDLFRLYLNIKRRGGFTQCNTSWKTIAAEIGLTQTANVAYSLKKIYERDLLPFEGINPASLNPSALSSEELQVKLMETVSPSIPSHGQAKETAPYGHLIKYVGDTSLDTNKILNLSQV